MSPSPSPPSIYIAITPEPSSDVDCPHGFYQLGEAQCEAYAAMQGVAYSDRLGPSDLMQGCILMNDVLTGTVPTYYHISGIYPNNGSSPDTPIGCAVGVTCICVHDQHRYPVSPPSAPAPPFYPNPPQKPNPSPPPPEPPAFPEGLPVTPPPPLSPLPPAFPLPSPSPPPLPKLPPPPPAVPPSPERPVGEPAEPPTPPPPVAPNQLDPCIYGEAYEGSRCWVRILPDEPCAHPDYVGLRCLTIDRPFHLAFVAGKCYDNQHRLVETGCFFAPRDTYDVANYYPSQYGCRRRGPVRTMRQPLWRRRPLRRPGVRLSTNSASLRSTRWRACSAVSVHTSSQG